MTGTMALIVGGAGLIGSAAARALLAGGGLEVVVVDRLGPVADRKWANLPAGIADVIAPEALEGWLQRHWRSVAVIVAMAEADGDADAVFEASVALPRMLWGWAVAKQRGFVFASSAHVYGDGSAGFGDDNAVAAVEALTPLSAFGHARRLFELQVLRAAARGEVPPFWTGLRVFSAYGAGEAHKGERASIPFRAARAAIANAPLDLYRSWSPTVADGHQARDFIHADDVGAITAWAVAGETTRGLLNAGTGVATPLVEVARAAFAAAGRQTQIRYVEPTDAVMGSVQTFTRADVSALRAAGYTAPFRAVTEAVGALSRVA